MAQQDGLQPAPLETTFADQPAFDSPMVNQPSLDLIELLPERAQDRLRKLRQRAADLHMVVPPFEELAEASTEKIKSERHLKRLTDPAPDGGFGLPLGDSRVVAAAKAVDKTSGDVRRLTELREARTVSWQAARSVLSTVEDWLRHGRLGNTTLETIEIEPPKLQKGEAIPDAVARLRKAGAELKADLDRIKSAPLPASYAKRKVREQVEHLAQRGAANVGALLIEHGDGKIQFQRELLRVQMHNIPKAPAATGYTEVIDPIAFAAWLDPQALIKKLDAEIDRKSNGPTAALTPEQRQQDEAAALADLLAIERNEAALIWQAQSQNISIEHRPECAPEAILGCRLLVTARPLPPPESSLEHAFGVTGR